MSSTFLGRPGVSGRKHTSRPQALKDLLLGRLAIDKAGPGYVHFTRQLPREWFEQLTAEQGILLKVNGKEAFRWVKRRPRNEVLDNRNYALHAAFGLGLHNYTDSRWADLEAAVQPPRDLFSVPPDTRAHATDRRTDADPRTRPPLVGVNRFH